MVWVVTLVCHRPLVVDAFSNLKNDARPRTCAVFSGVGSRGIHGINLRCHLERSERPTHFAGASGIHRSFASLRM